MSQGSRERYLARLHARYASLLEKATRLLADGAYLPITEAKEFAFLAQRCAYVQTAKDKPATRPDRSVPCCGRS